MRHTLLLANEKVNKIELRKCGNWGKLKPQATQVMSIEIFRLHVYNINLSSVSPYIPVFHFNDLQYLY